MRLIDADALRDEFFLKRYTERERNRNLVFAACEIKQDFADMVSNFQPVDAVEVVRCKDCKHYEIHKPKVLENCERNGYLIPMKLDDFCSHGERKDDDENG